MTPLFHLMSWAKSYLCYLLPPCQSKTRMLNGMEFPTMDQSNDFQIIPIPSLTTRGTEVILR